MTPKDEKELLARLSRIADALEELVEVMEYVNLTDEQRGQIAAARERQREDAVFHATRAYLQRHATGGNWTAGSLEPEIIRKRIGYDA